jgi:DNA topoisomerase IB
MRLRRVSVEGPGIVRRRRGRGFSYLEASGGPVDEATLGRIRALAIPPAWTDVWICPDPDGHIQATGLDAAGRRQYRYHDRWRARRDAQKFERMIAFAHALPTLRRRVEEDLRRPGLPREKALASGVRLLDHALFRIGSEEYVKQNGSFGLATVRKDHVRIRRDRAVFDFRAKSGKRLVQEVRDPVVLPVLAAMRWRRGGGPELLAYRDGRRWRDVRSSDVNDYIREASGGDHTAKDFRTWHATVLAAVLLASAVVHDATSRKRVAAASIAQVAEQLGNTPAVARASYVDPRVIDAFHRGATIAPALRRSRIDPPDHPDPTDPSDREAIEAAVLDLLDEERGSAVAA